MTQYNEWMGNISLDDIQTTSEKSIYSKFKDVLKDERITKVKITSDNWKNETENRMFEVTIKTDKNKEYKKDINLHDLSNMFLRIEIEAEKK